jgi:hypothetical protein
MPKMVNAPVERMTKLEYMEPATFHIPMGFD